MKTTLIVIEGARPARIPLQLPATVGRSTRAKVKVRAALVSRTHCELIEQDGQLIVRDLGSSNGTLVNGQRIERPTRLVTDDRLTIGPVTFRVLCDDACTTADRSELPSAEPEHRPQPGGEEIAAAPLSTRPLSGGPAADKAALADALRADQRPGVNSVESASAGGHPKESAPESDPAADQTEPERPTGAEPDQAITPPVSDTESVVECETSELGSVIHILEQAAAGPTERPVVLDEFDASQPPRVSSDDSALEDFFKGLDR